MGRSTHLFHWGGDDFPGAKFCVYATNKEPHAIFYFKCILYPLRFTVKIFERITNIEYYEDKMGGLRWFQIRVSLGFVFGVAIGFPIWWRKVVTKLEQYEKESVKKESVKKESDPQKLTKSEATNAIMKIIKKWES